MMPSAAKIAVVLPEDMIREMRERIRRSLADPRPDLSEAEVERHIADLHAETVRSDANRSPQRAKIVPR